MIYDFTPTQVKNIKLFFNRVEFSKGFQGVQEADAMKEILHVLEHPVHADEKNKTEKSK
jgi:hypothetical protein